MASGVRTGPLMARLASAAAFSTRAPPSPAWTPVPFFQIDSFANRPFAGNPAAVLLLDRDAPPLSDSTLASIAAECNLSETAFVTPRSNEDDEYDLRWFTPTREVALCGNR